MLSSLGLVEQPVPAIAPVSLGGPDAGPAQGPGDGAGVVRGVDEDLDQQGATW